MTAALAVYDRPDTTELKSKATALVLAAKAVVITDDATYTEAGNFGKAIMAYKKETIDKFAPHKQRAHAAHKGLCDDEANDLRPAEEAERILKGKMLEYRREQQKRQADEQRALAEKAHKLEEERRLQEAIELEAEGDTKAADEVLAAPIAAQVVAIPQRPATPKIAGIAPTKRWTFDIDKIDLDAVLCYIVGLPPGTKLAHPELRRVLTIDSPVVRQLVTAMRENFSIPGISAYEAEGLSLGSK